MNYYVYLTTNKKNKKMYIGKRSCKCSIEEDLYLGSGTLLLRAIKKHGKENFSKEILEICFSEEDCFEKEKYWISFYNAVMNKKFYNIADGGQGVSSNYYDNLTQRKKKEFSKKIKEGRIFSKEQNPFPKRKGINPLYIFMIENPDIKPCEDPPWKKIYSQD